MPALFGFENYWLYRHIGRGYIDLSHIGKDEILLTFIDVEINVDGQSELLSGVWMTFTTDSNGDLRDLVLLRMDDQEETFEEEEQVGVQVNQEETAEDEGANEEIEYDMLEIYENLDKNPFVIKYSNVANLGLYYVSVNTKTKKGRILEGVWRS